MKQSTAIARLLCVLALCILAGVEVRADVPPAPQNLEAHSWWRQIDNQTWVQSVYLTWSIVPDANRPVEYFAVYGAEGEKQDYTGFEHIQNLYVRVTNDTLGWEGGAVIDRQPGTHSFYVTGLSNNGEGEPSNIATVTIGDTATLFFTEYPQAYNSDANAEAFIGEPYMYQVGATTWSDGTIQYNLAPISGSLPAGLSIDANTGVLTWTPATKGVYLFKIQASMPEYPGLVVEAVASIRVYRCAEPALITGTVLDQNGNPVTGGVVSVLPVNIDTLKIMPLYGNLSETGTFSIAVDDGSYILLVDGDGVKPEYYEDTDIRENATVIEVECGETVDVTMNVHRIAMYRVSGRVTDQDDNGFPLVSVTLMAYNPELPEDIRRQYPRYFTTYTGEDGTYSFYTPENYVYIAVATIRDANSNSRGAVQVQFFDHVGSIGEAEEFVLTGDRSDVNFDFVLGVVYDNSISGRVTTGDNEGVPAYIVAYSISGPGYVTTMSDANGNYTLHNILPGEYAVYIAPNSGNLSPGYYHEDGSAVYAWNEATIITVGNNTHIAGINVEVVSVDSAGNGKGLVSGNVRGDASGIVIGKNSGDKVLGSSPINGALITLIDSKGNVTRYNFSANNGDFSLNNLATGVYTIVIDKIGFAPYKGSVEIKNNEPVVIDAVLEAEVTTGVGETAGAEPVRIYPNPAVDNTVISFRAAHGTTRIAVVNGAGVEVLSVNKQTTEGDNALLLDTRQLSAGAYFVRISTGAARYALPLHIVR